MTSTRRLSGAVALGLSVALTGAFAAPSFADPAEGATIETSTFVTVTIDGVEYGQLTDLYTDGTRIVTVFTDADGDKEVDHDTEAILSVTEISTDGTETVTVEEGDVTTVTETTPDGTVTETVTNRAAGTEVVTVTAPDETSTVTTTTVEGEKADPDGQTVTVLEEVFDAEGELQGSTETITVTKSDFTSETVTVTEADGTTTVTVTVTQTDSIVETVTEYDAEGNPISMERTTREQTSDTVTEEVTEPGVDGEVGTADDIVTVTVTNPDGSGTISVYDGTGELISHRQFSSSDPEPEPEPQPEPEPAVVFSDNPPNSAFYLPVQWMAENGISVGYADGTYKKTRDVSRGETAAFLFRYIDPVDFDAPPTSPFGDLNEGGAFYDAITWAAAEEVTVGDTEGNFNASEDVTRGEFAAFLYRLSGVNFDAPSTSPFGDLNAGGANYEAVTWLASEGITVGDTQGDFNQSDEITRGEISAFMQRYNAFVAG
ncbi:S-layer homology domain-containing protein [Citricoccus sp. GCM10030269]|uniref:S-layer homology domain-containing protein n=1 Tax=Citricoccus sp. GCM10030269 TaxID=3273388 RepID=UPI003614653E